MEGVDDQELVPFKNVSGGPKKPEGTTTVPELLRGGNPAIFTLELVESKRNQRRFEHRSVTLTKFCAHWGNHMEKNKMHSMDSNIIIGINFCNVERG